FGPSQDDVAQEVWRTVHECLPSYDPAIGTPRAWLAGIVRRCAANHRRRLRREKVGFEDDLLAAAIAQRESGAEVAMGGLRGRGPLAPDEQALIFWMLRRAFESDEQLEAFVLCYFFGYSYAEIAEIQGVTKGAVEHRLNMAKDRLRGDDDKA